MSEIENLNEMLRIRHEKLDLLIQSGRDPHHIEKYPGAIYAAEIKSNYDQYEGKSVRVAGRIMSKRKQGKVAFMGLLDASGKIQLFNRLNDLGESLFEEVKNLDIGDIVGVDGEVFTTKTGEISIRSKNIQLLTKSLQLLPEKWHGLKDPDLRYRQRYVDLIMNPDIKKVFMTRSKVISAIRHFLDDRGFLEVETPILNTIAGGANARPFVTHHNALDIDMYLRIANELYLKRLIVGGFDKVYEMGRMFRNEGMDHSHNPEYTAMELYQAYADYQDMMEITEQLVSTVAMEVLGTNQINFGEYQLDFTPPWKRISMVEAIQEHTGIDCLAIETNEEAKDIAKEKGLEFTDGMTRGQVIAALFEEFCEGHMIQPTFVIKHPVEVSPLAKRDPLNPLFTQRFEAFVATKEIANAFSELNDARDQRRRFEKQVEARLGGDEEAQMMDHDFLNALEVGMPPAGGLGIGIDRLVMFLTNQKSIRDVLLFPTMKPIGPDISDVTETIESKE